MSADLEHQLAASLPGRPTAVLDYARIFAARQRIQLAVELLQGAIADLRTTFPGGRPETALAEESALTARRAAAALDITLHRMPT